MRLASLLFLLMMPLGLLAQPAAPLHETRGVWLATVLQDGGWPDPNASAPAQEEALRQLIRDAHELGINTFYFQAIARGDAMYPSRRLPVAPTLRNAGYDPLAAAIDEAHRLGIELHAWVNVFRVGDRDTERAFRSANGPPHIMYARPEWVKQYGRDLWLNPASDEAQAWMLENVLEIVRRYDVDGIQFDFIRYPAGGLTDDAAGFAQNTRGIADIDTWRRANVTRFVEMAGSAIRNEKPWLKVGATPLGNYEESPEWNALRGFSDTFQASRTWLQQGYLDYLAPQIYFSTGTAPEGDLTFKSPDFIQLLEEWVDESAGRPIMAGIAAYKATQGKFPVEDVTRQIQTTRENGGGGHVFFRYDHMQSLAEVIRPHYTTPALIPPLAHRTTASPPSRPIAVRASGIDKENIVLSWTPSIGSADDPIGGYAVYRSVGRRPSHNYAGDLYKVLSASTLSLEDARDAGETVYYQITALSRLGMQSEPSEVLVLTPPSLVAAGR